MTDYDPGWHTRGHGGTRGSRGAPGGARGRQGGPDHPWRQKVPNNYEQNKQQWALYLSRGWLLTFVHPLMPRIIRIIRMITDFCISSNAASNKCCFSSASAVTFWPWDSRNLSLTQEKFKKFKTTQHQGQIWLVQQRIQLDSTLNL